ncbi:F-box domain [Macleaya cordata]|uniref:F-box domain n=1 Tax=Macleaya cordata TaxID=56857 RepID=A0A200RAE6_MACCD|nr:F-box domain [Macleaya cordata]
MLLKKVWETVSSLPPSFASSSSERPVLIQSSTGAFDQIPSDIFLQILKFLGPKEAARLSIVCKSWKLLVSDNRLWVFFLQQNHHHHHHQDSWDTIVFAEKHLRSGYPLLLQTIYNQSPQLSFMHIYSQRAQLTGSVIIDGGSGYCKFGWSKYAAPSGRSATFLEFGNIESPMYSRLRHFFATIYSRMQVKPSRQPIVVSIPICHSQDTESAKAARRQLKETIYSVLFDMNVPAVCAINQAILALYAARRTSGIVVNIGFHVTSVVPILRGKVMREVGVEVVGLGAIKLTGFLKEKMQQQNMSFESLYTVRTLKENLCYVAADYGAELNKDTQASFKVSGEDWFTLSKERFQTGEILFQPRMGGVHTMGLHQAVALCMDRCQAAEVTADDGWFKTVVLAGGTACLSGLPDRLEKELRALLPPSISEGLRVLSPPYGAESAWFGAKIISNMSTFCETWCLTKKQFRQKSRRNFISSW